MNRRQVFGEVLLVETVIAGFVFVAVLGLLAFCLVRRRAGAGVSASQRAERPGLEGYYVAALASVAVLLVGYTAWQNHREQDPKREEPVRIDVSAFQWCWSFGYPQAEKPLQVSGACRGKQQPTVVVPTGRPVTFTLTSKDVIHSLWVPELRYKMDAFPDHRNTFTLTVDREGRWKGRCAEFCGERHSTMDFWFKAVSPEEYEQWVDAHAGASTARA
ncbi:cytochrome c oxidase subunit II [Streptomyces xiaopingdaonensis]|uniref:cytochrome c oxidase subunit II n=1 Tax=Streptomyces xiaopingdaonensis TaxID=1565415 RepID=UPI0002ECEF78|nr:cytochrome c oxidase subunit II [Streptomyces xiaopingdaonensis]